MEKIEKTLKYIKLFNLYGALLSCTQQEILKDYYFADLSISEISENREISRAAVEDALSKGSTKLDSIEESLKILDKKALLQEKVHKLQDITDEQERAQILNELLEELNDGI